MNGIVIVDKPPGLTSHDVVNRLRRILRQRSVGHLGTLDPLATGVLPIVVGNYTRLAQFYLSAEKSYQGVIRFGFATTTYDAEGEATTAPQLVHLDAGQIHSLAAQFRGMIEQTPPPFSAKKIHGVAAYKLARKHQEVVLKPVQVEVRKFDITEVSGDRIQFSARVSSGTYIRSVAHDMGVKLGCGAHLESLHRTAVAEFSIEDAKTVEQVQNNQSASQPVSDRQPLTSAHCLFHHPRLLLPQMPSVSVDESTAARIRNGRTVNLAELSQARQVKVFCGQTELIAIATRVAGTLFHPKMVLGTGPFNELAMH